MYTTKDIARKTSTKTAAVRYFARTHNVPKVKIKNREVYIFDEVDFNRFCFYIKGHHEKKADKQLTFDFYNEQNRTCPKRNKKQQVIKSRMCTLLKEAGAKGVRRIVLCALLDINDTELERVLSSDPFLPIGEDDRIDDRIYWVGSRTDLERVLGL